MISSDDFALRTCFGFKSTALKRKFPAGSKSRVNSGLRHGATVIRITCSSSRAECCAKSPWNWPTREPAWKGQSAPDARFASRRAAAGGHLIGEEDQLQLAWSATKHPLPACHKRTSRPFDSSPPGDGLVRASTVPGLVHVNRRSNLTPHRLPILSPLSGGVWW
jgi:hypothetical protein